MLPNLSDIRKEVLTALEEDIGSGDVTAALLADNSIVYAEIISREPMVVCGQPWVEHCFNLVDPNIQLTWMVREGQWLTESSVLCKIAGNAKTILTAERTALNFFQTLAGTATQTHLFVEKIKKFPTRLLDTRKTLPGLRYAQKYAVTCGGGSNHRMGLFDAFLIKENHIKACGGIRTAIQKARKINQHLLLEIEVEDLQELKLALAEKPDRILLDNFSIEMLKKAVELNQPKRCDLEASGGIHLQNIADVAATGVDFISVGTITKSVQAIDLSLLIKQIEDQSSYET